MHKSFRKGDKVKWHSSQGVVTGHVEKKLNHAAKIKNFKINASKDEPFYLVKSDRTSAEAAHKAEALQKI